MKPSLQELQELQDYTILTVYDEMYSDMKTPISVLKNLKAISKKHYLLESVTSDMWSRYSFLGFDPIMEISAKDNLVTISKNDDVKSFISSNPLDEIRKILANYKTCHYEELPNFAGGFVGYFAYDTIKYAEKSLNINSIDEVDVKDFHLMLFDKVIAFDTLKQKIILMVNIETINLEANYNKALKEIENLKTIIKADYHNEIKQNKIIEPLTSNMTYEEYSNKIMKIKDYIKNGDIFQCVFSQRFKAKIDGDLFNTYRVLRTLNPSPYMVYLDTNEVQIAGASPETLVKKEGNLIQTFPIAGTRPRGKSIREDKALEAELLVDEKELAEHNMLVDLGRNDVGRVSKFGSVEVIDYKKVMKFSHVMHITSTVNGIIKNECDAIDALSSILPAGTLSGAPKIRACQIIDELEGVKRGIYGGAMGYIDFRGNMDMCIVIRTAIKKGDYVYVQSGGGIVLDSDPKLEYEETKNKAFAMMKAIRESEGELK